MPRDWTDEARAQFGERMRKARAARTKSDKSNKPNGEHPTVPPPESFSLDLDAAAPVLNPIANDVVKSPALVPHAKRAAAPARQRPTMEPESKPDAIAYIIRGLEKLPLDSISYADCGLLLNALSACSTAVALARRQKQEQLEAGTHRAPCKTCGRMIDISKAGGFQILTERDEFHMPRNSYYCSQNCLLARNMPSHARQTPKEKKENRA